MDPDPYSVHGSGSRKLLNTDPIRIRIHNTDYKLSMYQQGPTCVIADLLVCSRYNTNIFVRAARPRKSSDGGPGLPSAAFTPDRSGRTRGKPGGVSQSQVGAQYVEMGPVLWNRSILVQLRLQLVKMAAPAPAPALAL